MKRFATVLAVLLIVAGLMNGLWQRSRPTHAPAPPVPSPSRSVAHAAPATPAPLPAVRTAVPPPPAPPAPPLPPDHPARAEAENVALHLRHFGQRFGGNPVGTNAEIVKTLNGGNAKGVRYLPQESLRLNGQGELTDSWGTPYFFHQLSASETEIRSAGPDRILWTADDILAK